MKRELAVDMSGAMLTLTNLLTTSSVVPLKVLAFRGNLREPIECSVPVRPLCQHGLSRVEAPREVIPSRAQGASQTVRWWYEGVTDEHHG